MIQKISHVIMNIFFEMSTYGERAKNIYNPQDLTEHYRGELVYSTLDGVYIAANYSDISYTIEAYKYRSDRQHVGEYVDLLARIVEKYDLLSHDDIALVSVPMHWSRYMIRGFNHIDLLTSGLSYRLGIHKIKPIRAYWTHRQSKLSKMKRMKNREHAFVLRSGILPPKTVILIDDIISTGSTANSCAKILKSAGVEKVYGVFIASNQ
ncbi:ComF family protein [Candidatus Gracilibacteria bacterium]|nr:ComF family protein [Candidatus Gracilibacteria bacterium]